MYSRGGEIFTDSSLRIDSRSQWDEDLGQFLATKSIINFVSNLSTIKRYAFDDRTPFSTANRDIARYLFKPSDPQHDDRAVCPEPPSTSSSEIQLQLKKTQLTQLKTSLENIKLKNKLQQLRVKHAEERATTSSALERERQVRSEERHGLCVALDDSYQENQELCSRIEKMTSDHAEAIKTAIFCATMNAAVSLEEEHQRKIDLLNDRINALMMGELPSRMFEYFIVRNRRSVRRRRARLYPSRSFTPESN